MSGSLNVTNTSTTDLHTDDFSSSDEWTESDSLQPLFEQRVAINIKQFVSPFLLFFGTFGNILSLIVLYKLSREIFSTCSYLAVLTVADVLLLYTRCGSDWLREVIYSNVSYILMVYSQSVCKVYPFTYNFLFHMSRWLLVAMAIEGFIATRYPQRALHMCTVQRAKAIMLLLTVLLVCVNVHYFWSFEVTQESGGLECTFSRYSRQYSEEFQTVIWPLIDLMVGELLPNVIIIICGVGMMVLTIRGNHRGSESHQRWRSRYTMDPHALDHLKRTFLLVCVFHVTLTMPNFAFIIFRYTMEQKGPYYDDESKVELASAVCSMLQYIFLSCKVFLYMSSCPKFRTEIYRLMRCGCQHKVHNPEVLVSQPLMNKESSTSSGLNVNSTSSGHKWRNMENAELESPILCPRGNNRTFY